MTSDVFTFCPDYLEFYLVEPAAMKETYYAWPVDAVEVNLLPLTSGFGIRTYPNMDVQVVVTIEVLESAPPLTADFWQRINECSISCPTGSLILSYWGWAGNGGDAGPVSVTPGDYRARVYYGGQTHLAAQFLNDESLNGFSDFYRIALWPAPLAPLEVIKSLESPVAQPKPPSFCHKVAEGENLHSGLQG